jgi:flagellar motor switch protein FliM
MQNPESLILPVKFGSTNSIGSSQMQRLTALVQIFTRAAGFRLGAWLSTAARVNLVSVERIVFSDFLEGIAQDGSYVASLRVQPVNAPCLSYMDICLIDPIIDLLLGGIGSGSLSPESTDITDIEASILDSVMQEICAELTNAWKSVGIEVHHQQRLLSSYHGQAMPARDNALCLSFELQVGEVRGNLRLLFSGLASDALLRAATTESTRSHLSPALEQELRQRALRFRYAGTLQLPVANVSAQVLNELRPGSVLPLEISTAIPALFIVAGQPMFQAQPVAIGERKGAYLTQASLKPGRAPQPQ